MKLLKLFFLDAKAARVIHLDADKFLVGHSLIVKEYIENNGF